VLRTVPVTGVLLLVGLFAVTGSPPFGTFLSEFTIVRAAWAGGHPWIATATLTLLAVIFIGMASVVLRFVYGAPALRPAGAPAAESGWLLTGPVVLALASLALGLAFPGVLQRMLVQAATALGGTGP
jgi:hydrogenase-4 component F